MPDTKDIWTPPEGMPSKVVSEWRAFYRAAMVKYNVTPAVYQDLYVIQKGRCWICRIATGKNPMDPKGHGGRRLGIDHNHVTGQVRGLLCTGGDKTCNRTIGWHGAAALRRAADYLDGTLTPGLIYAYTGGDAAITEALLWLHDPQSVPVIAP